MKIIYHGKVTDNPASSHRNILLLTAMLFFLFQQIWTLGLCGNKYAMPQLLCCDTHYAVTRVFLYKSYLLKVEAGTTGDPKAKGWVAFVCNRVIIVPQFCQPVASTLKVHSKPHYLSICIYFGMCAVGTCLSALILQL